MKKPFLFTSLSQRGGRAQFRMMLPFDGAPSASLDAMRETIISQIKAAAAQGAQPESESQSIVSQMPTEQPAPTFNSRDELEPKEEDYIRPDFRALSQALVECYCLDYSTPGVLEKSVPLLQGQTVYKDHCFYRVADWVGVIDQSMWDAKGEKSGGTPGINVELKIDWKKNPWIARGLMMKPPAIHSFSVSVLFEFEFSHPDLVEQGRFWSLLGEEVEGEIVRLIVTKILGYWEGSLVFQGADTLAKQLLDDETEGSDEEQMGAKKRKMDAGPSPEQSRQESLTVKLTQQQKTALGLSAHEAEDVPESLVLPAVDALAVQAAAGSTLLEKERAECLRVAKLAIVGSGEGELPEALATIIQLAPAAQLTGLTQLYTEQALKRFPPTCQDCGSHNVSGRSSVEDTTEIEKLGAAKPVSTPAAPNSIF